MFGRGKKFEDSLGVELGLPPGAVARVLHQPDTDAYKRRGKTFKDLVEPGEKLINVYNLDDGVLVTNTHIIVGIVEPSLRTVRYPHQGRS